MTGGLGGLVLTGIEGMDMQGLRDHEVKTLSILVGAHLGPGSQKDGMGWDGGSGRAKRRRDPFC